MIIRIERDYSISGDIYPQFCTSYVSALEPYVPPTEWHTFVVTLNDHLRVAFCPWTFQNVMDGFLAVFTLYLSEFLLGSFHRKRVAALELFVQEFASAHGMKAASLRNMAFLCLCFHVTDAESIRVSRQNQLSVSVSPTLSQTPSTPLSVATTSFSDSTQVSRIPQ
ncbi:palmitoyltransferase complex Erf4 [Schizosaccharomyces japonicus yFS275]|uniref:Ras modification protein ERF4 n=1 Tax=Schizosaccharomyces japonicus (strain yFS275 / FY16936) TaxID=402676 RepID=B6K0F5_SCHJY|nr:palmitoyltransferase complex Erf4 [Schizosaccharomyces japonicus yFS275]EEB06305.1 palmitoyltransferase complex Erf4 [Schizosaccharomyces japonicus yFS275]